MIIKASQRGSGANLAVHLMRTDENEHVSLHELRGFASDNLMDAFKETEAISRGTKCRQYLFSVSLNPPESERVPVEVFEDTLGRIEKRLGLAGQPRAVVFHEKEGRRHAHCVWSRIDAETMKAKQLSFFKAKLNGLSRDLYLEHGWKMPRGMTNKAERDPTNFSLAEWQQAKRQGVDPRWLKATIQECWKSSDNLRAFEHSLQERSFFLAKGDRRGHVVLDHTGEVYSLPRMLDLKAKEVRARLGDGSTLKSVEEAQEAIGNRMTPAIRRHIEEARSRFQERANTLGAYKTEMTKLHRAARAKLDEQQKREWDAETLIRAKRLPRGLRGLWHRLTGKYQEVRRFNEAEAQATRERHRNERQDLIDKQLQQRAVLQTRTIELRRTQAEQLVQLRRDINRYQRFSKSMSQSLRLSRSRGRGMER